MLISWNTTRACNQACAHCYRDAGTRQEEELTTEQGLNLIEEIAKAGFKILVLSGGEPLMRGDLFELIEKAVSLGMRPVLGTNGTLLTPELVQRLKEAGVARVGISLDSPDPGPHDQFRGMPGAWQGAVDAMRYCREAGMPFQVHTTVTQRNKDRIGELIDFAESVGAAAHHIFFLVPTGRGKDLADEILSPEEYEGLLKMILERQRTTSMELRPVCAPQFMRIAAEEGIPMRFTKGCLAGTAYCVIIPNGEVNPCPYLPLSVGNVKDTPFSEIWSDSPLLKTFREESLHGACGACEYQNLCGGCRARAYYESGGEEGGDFLATDEWCSHAATITV
jgi:putative heme d1 biosynthesis radical SAM protein NirJ2